MKQGQGETIDAYIKRYRKIVERAESEITEEEQTIKFTEGALAVYYSFATMGNAVNLTEAISNAKKAERGVTRQLTPQQEFIPDNRIYEEMNKEVIQKDEDKLEKMFKEMKIQLLQEVRGNNSYRNTGYRNNREVICYKCEKKGHYAPNCQGEETQEKKCYICGSKNHLVRECNNRGNQRDNTRNNTRSNIRNNNRDNLRNNERHLNYLGIDSSEGSEIPTEGESSSEEDYERRFYSVSTRSQGKYRNAGTNRRDKLDNNEYRRIDKLAEQNNRRLNSESQKELELQNDENDSSDDDMNSQKEPVKSNEMNKRNNAIMKALETKRKKNKCKKCGGIGHFVPDCPTLTEGEREWHEKVRQQNKEKRKERSKKHVEFEGEFDILNSPCGLTIKQAMKYIPTYK